MYNGAYTYWLSNNTYTTHCTFTLVSSSSQNIVNIGTFKFPRLSAAINQKIETIF